MVYYKIKCISRFIRAELPNYLKKASPINEVEKKCNDRTKKFCDYVQNNKVEICR